MRGMSGEHWALLATFLAAVAMQIGMMEDSWEHVFKPSFISFVLLQLATLIRAMFTAKPSRHKHRLSNMLRDRKL